MFVSSFSYTYLHRVIQRGASEAFFLQVFSLSMFLFLPIVAYVDDPVVLERLKIVLPTLF